MLISFNSVARGTAHIEKEMPCQDAAHSITSKEKTIAIAIVADGHGGEKYFRSDVGSKTAVNKTELILRNFCKTLFTDELEEIRKDFKKSKDKVLERNIPKLEQDIIKRWRKDVLEHFAKNPLTEKEQQVVSKHKLDTTNEDTIASFYGTTLVAALVTPVFYLAIQIGDGLCVKITHDGAHELAVPEDERLGFGATTSLCDTTAKDNFRHNFGADKVQGLIAATDGVADSFETEKYFDFLAALRQKFTDAPKTAKSELDNFLPTLSEKGSRDDCAIAGIWRVG